jgi:ATP-dependent Clp protease adaptor protein ClpS
MSETLPIVEPTTKVSIMPPSMYDVIFYNDQKTPYEFVVLIIMHLFGKSYETAVELTTNIHIEGRGLIATYTYEVAATKRDETVATARENNHPLRVEIEPSSATE